MITCLMALETPRLLCKLKILFSGDECETNKPYSFDSSGLEATVRLVGRDVVDE